MPKKKPADLVTEARNNATELEIRKAKQEATKQKALLRESHAREEELERKLDFLLESGGKVKPKAIRKPARSKAKGVAAVVPATDWHVEEVITHDGTNGKNRFDLAIAESRIKRFYQKVPELIEWQNHLAPVTELWHPLLGDLMTGYIHEELMETNSLSPTEASLFIQEHVCSGIEFLKKETGLPIYVPTCVGNHGRTTPRKRIKTSYKNSFEWLLYETLAGRYAGDPRVEFRVGRGYHNTQEIMGRVVRFHHGDGLRYQGGVGGITIPVNKAIAQWNKVRAADFDIFGHWHTHLVNYPTWISCGCLVGYSEYSVEIKADFQHPTQTFIVIDRRYGLTQATPIFLEKPKRN
jgi:hypothetical protein